MPKIVLKEKTLKSKIIFSGKAVSFRIDTVELPNGKRVPREYMDHPGAVAILPVLKNGNIVLVKQYRHPVGKITYEVPAGKLHGKEDSFLKRGKAELKEETGYTAKNFEFLVSFWPTPAFSNETLKIYLAKNLRNGRAKPDEDEFLNVVEVPRKEVVKMIRSGRIKDSKTIIAILSYLLEKKGKAKRWQSRRAPRAEPARRGGE